MKNVDGVFEMENYVDKWFFNSNLLPKSEEEWTEVISRLLFTFIAHKLQQHLNFSNIFLHLSQVEKRSIHSHFESMQSVIKYLACSFKSM